MNFAKVAANVARRPRETTNVLPDLLRGWFGASAGASGTAQYVLAEKTDSGWGLRPRPALDARTTATLLQRYRREGIPPLFGAKARGRIWDQGFIRDAGHIFLLVTLDKSDLPKEHAYGDRFQSDRVFEWQSQNRMAREMPMSLALRDHVAQATPVHLFVRPRAKIDGKGAPFLYLGEVEFREWKGDRPITVTFVLKDAVPEALWRELRVPGDAPPWGRRLSLDTLRSVRDTPGVPEMPVDPPVPRRHGQCSPPALHFRRMGMTVTGRVMNGRLVVDEPTELPEGAVVALRLLDEETVAPASESATVDNGRVFDAMEAIARSVPDECWAQLPTDAAEKLDEHLRRGIR